MRYISSFNSSSISKADSLTIAFHIVIEPRDGMLLFPSALFWHWALLPKLVRGYRKYHTPLLYVWVHSITQNISVKAEMNKYITTFIYTNTNKNISVVSIFMSSCNLTALKIKLLSKQTNKNKLHLRIIHITLSLAVRPLSLCFSFLLLRRRLIRGGWRMGQGTSLYGGRCLGRLLWQRCHPLTLWGRTTNRYLFSTKQTIYWYSKHF